MIKLLRVDDKLLHGQIAFSWVRNLKIHTIIVADDRVAYDEFSKMTLGLSKPAGVNLLILDLDAAIESMKEHVDSKINVMAIVNSIANAHRILSEVKSIKTLNLGVLREHYNTTLYSEHISLDVQDISLCQQLIADGCEIEMRLRYDDPRVLFHQMVERKE